MPKTAFGWKNSMLDMTGIGKPPAMSNKKAILLVLIAGVVVYYFAIHRRGK